MSPNQQRMRGCTQGVFRIGLLLLSATLSVLMPAPSASGQSPTSGSSLLDRADKLIKQGKTADAIALLDPLAQQKPTATGVETLLGRAYFTSKQYQQAILHLQRAAEQSPEDWESVQLLALSYYAQGNCQETL